MLLDLYVWFHVCMFVCEYVFEEIAIALSDHAHLAAHVCTDVHNDLTITP